MSFILDALRKSETERQRQAGPGLADAGYRPPLRRRRIWLPLLVIVLLANLVLLSLVWLRSNSPPAEPAAIAPAPTMAPQSAAISRTRPNPQPVADADLEAMANAPALEPDEPATSAAGTGPDTPYGDAPEPAADAVADIVTDDLPTAGQLMASGALPTRPMHLDIHVYSTTPAERFVFINTRRYAEGAQLTEGPQIEEITPEGVVLNENGQRFLLTRE